MSNPNMVSLRGDRLQTYVLVYKNYACSAVTQIDAVYIDFLRAFIALYQNVESHISYHLLTILVNHQHHHQQQSNVFCMFCVSCVMLRKLLESRRVAMGPIMTTSNIL